MSGIAGLYYPDGRPVDPADLGRMADVLAHRGPDGADVWLDGPVGLAHRMLHTTPESLAERLPAVSLRTGCVITADARLDNRDELLAALDLAAERPAAIADSALILAAYERWGERCPERLLGDFAFAIWDPRERRLFCARDHMGVRPFYYYAGRDVFAFASEIKGLLAVPQVPRRLNERRVAEYLDRDFEDTVITFYEEILRLPPAHHLTVGPEGTMVQAYWALDPTRDVRLASPEAYTEAFLELFTEAVRCRLRSHEPVGALLSGGLDSSSIACVARQLQVEAGAGPLRTFSGIYAAGRACDERAYIDAVLAKGGFEPHFIQADESGPLGELEAMLAAQGEPFFAPNLYLNWQLNRRIAESGTRVFLDGFDGDTTLSHGYGRLMDLARQGRWLALASNTRAVAGTYQDISWPKATWEYAWQHGIEPRLRRRRGYYRGRQLGQALARRWPWWSRTERDRANGHSLVKPAFADRFLSDASKRRFRVKTDTAERSHHYGLIMMGLRPFALEVLDRVTAAFSIEARYPFWDLRLVEFSLALPPEQKLDGGWSRLILRRAMAGLLPDEVRWRRDKADFSAQVATSLLARDRLRLDALISETSEILDGYADSIKLDRVYHAFVDSYRASDLFVVWSALTLSVWLQTLLVNDDVPSLREVR